MARSPAHDNCDPYLAPDAAPNLDRAALREVQLAERWQVSRRTLQRWREHGTGPAWLQINGVILYRLDDIRAFEDARRQGGQP